jgi:hypothetical protein
MSSIKLFENKQVRSLWDEERQAWYFSIVDVVGVLTDSSNPRKYWSVLKTRLKKESSELATKCSQLKMQSADGKNYLTDVADTEQLLRLIQSIPSPKAEPLKQWLARVGYERIEETEDPELALDRAMETYLKKGYSRDWVNQRLKSIEVRKELTDEWEDRGVKKGSDFAILTDEITQAWSGMTTSQYKQIKTLKKENLRDHMTVTPTPPRAPSPTTDYPPLLTWAPVMLGLAVSFADIFRRICRSPAVEIKPTSGMIMLLFGHVNRFRPLFRKPGQGLPLAVWPARSSISFERIATSYRLGQCVAATGVKSSGRCRAGAIGTDRQPATLSSKSTESGLHRIGQPDTQDGRHGAYVARSLAAISSQLEGSMDFRLCGQTDRHLAKRHRRHADWRESASGRHPGTSDSAGGATGPKNQSDLLYTGRFRAPSSRDRLVRQSRSVAAGSAANWGSQ